MSTVLCICTYRRPDGLRKLLLALPTVQGSEDLTIVVADNDAKAEGIAVCNELSNTDYPFDIYTIQVNEPGISEARNAACLKALSLAPEMVAFLDDDEWPETQWLSELRRVQHNCGVDMVGGPTLPVFPDDTPTEILDNPYYGANMNLPDQTRCQLQAGGNLLIKAEVLATLSPNFYHTDFTRSGGEDLAFFEQLHQNGHTMAWATNAIVHEPVPASRLQPGWIRHRVITIHNSRVRVMQMLKPQFRHRLVRGLKTTALGTVALIISAVSWLSPDLAMRARELRWKFQGKLSAHLGRTVTRKESY